MIIVEVRTDNGKVIEHRAFSVYATAVAFFESVSRIYSRGVSITFGANSF